MMWLSFIIILVTAVVTVICTVYVSAAPVHREERRPLEKRRQDATGAATERLGYGMPYPTTAAPAPDMPGSAIIQAELAEATAERDKVRRELAGLKRLTAVRAFDDQRRCRELLEHWDWDLRYGADLDGRHCRDQLAESLQAEAVTIKSFDQTHARTVRTYR